MDDRYFVSCPLLRTGRDTDPAPCKQECCAWWHTYNRPGKALPGRCALVSIADALMDMNLIGVDVNDNGN